MIASRNKGKIKEYKAMLEPLGYEIISLLDYPEIPEIAETGLTFEENALLKARTVGNLFAFPVIADDSGLEVACLGGKPGVNSKRFSLEENDRKNNELLLEMMLSCNDRSARFVTKIVFFQRGFGHRVYEGFLEGQIALKPVNGNGFGYDPLFYLPDKGKMMSELTTNEKNEISHRGRALKQLIGDISENGEAFGFQ